MLACEDAKDGIYGGEIYLSGFRIVILRSPA
jgi:hypothetical protein